MDPFNIKTIENGKAIKQLTNYKCNERSYLLNIKWKGCVDGELCIGVELINDSSFGTDGTFSGKKIFNSVQGRGVLVPIFTINSLCEEDKHNKIEKYSDEIVGVNKNFHSINPDCICCVEPLKCTTKYPSIQIGSRIKYIKRKQFFDGVCKWLGLVNGKESIGAQMKEMNTSGTIGRFNNFKLFNCEPKKGFLFLIEDIKHDFENEKLHFICDKIVDTNKIYFVSLFDKQHENPHFIGSSATTILTTYRNQQKMIGEIKWIGKINNEKCVGLDMEDKFDFGINGKIDDYHKFNCLEGHGMITLLNNIKLLEKIDESYFCKNGIINPNKYLVCKEKLNNEFLNSRNVKLNEFVFVLLKDSYGERKKKGILRWCGRMNQLSVCIIELNEEHELGTDGRFWRTQLIKCGNKRAIAVLSSNIYQFKPYESMIIPVDDRLFKDIDINSYVKCSDKCQEVFKGLYGTIRWSGKDENNQYLYGIELEDKFSFGSNGEFKGQKLFDCQNGFGVLVSVISVIKVVPDIDKIKQDFSRFYFSSNNVDLKCETIKNLMKIKDKSILKSIISCPEHPIDLDVHHDLLQILINENEFEIVKLLLHNCTNYNSYNDVFLNLSNIALSNDDDELFDLSVDKCTNKNVILQNGETFLTNLFKENCDENILNKIIDKKIFDTNITNKNSELPLILACERVMISTVEKIVNNKPLYTYHKNLALNMVTDAENKLSQLNRSMGDIIKIVRLLTNTPTNNSMECSICFDNEISLVFQCGHFSCAKCIEKLIKCPFCDQEIKTPIKIYLN